MRFPFALTPRLAVLLPVSLLVTLVPAAAVVSTFTITTVSLPNGVDGVAFSDQLTSTGGTGTVTWKLATGSSLVTGLKLSTSGLVSGTPTASTNGAGNFTVVATDSAIPAHTATAKIAYIINPENGTFRITSTSFPNATVGSAYSSSITSDGAVPVTYVLIDGTSLPAGLTLHTGGAITGTPTAPNAGTLFQVEATESGAKTVTAYLSLLVSPSAISVSPLTLTGATVGVAYTKTFTATGGKSPYKWSIVSGSPWNGLSLNSSTGVLSGTPTLPTVGSVDSSFQIEVSDSSSPAKADFATIKITIAPAPLKVQTTTVPTATVGTSYSTTLLASGGIAPFTWSLASSSSPPPTGLKLSSAGVLSGTPTTPSGSGPWIFGVEVKDSEKTPMTAFGSISIQVNPAPNPLTIYTSLPPAYVGSSYAGQLFASGGTFPYKWSLAGTSKLPAGLTLASSGAITGKPTMANSTFTVNVKATDSSKPAAQTATATVTLPVYPALAQCKPTNPSAATNAKFKGAYSVHLERIDMALADTAFWTLGSFTADGAGHIAGGVSDTNGPSFKAESQSTFTGTYSVGTDDRGLLTVTAKSSTGTVSTASYCFALDSFTNGVAGAGQLVEDDPSGIVGHGRFYAQGLSDITETSVKGSWAFGMQGAKVDQNQYELRAAAAGYMTLDGKGNVTVGEIDISENKLSNDTVENQYSPQIAITGTYTVASNGRGTLTLNNSNAGSSQTDHLTFYVAGNNQLLVLVTDPGETPSEPDNCCRQIMVGRAFQRTTSTFNNKTLDGNSVFVSEGVPIDGNTYGLKVSAGIFDFNGAGTLTGSADKKNSGVVTLAPNNTISADYSVDAEGRVTLTESGEENLPVFYLVGPNQGFGVDASTNVDFYQVENQVVPPGGFTASSLEGGYSIGSLWYSFIQETALSGEILANDTAKTFTATVDMNQAGFLAVDQPIDLTYVPATSGRFVVSESSAQFALYIVSPTKAYSVPINPGANHDWDTLFEFNHQ